VKKSEWSDKQLEELLRQMPKIQDHRNPRDIYQNLSIKKKKMPTWIIPSFATAAALLLFFLLVPRLLDGTQTQYFLDSAKQEESASDEKISLTEDKSSLMREKEDTARSENGIAGTEPEILMTGNKTALYDDDVGNETAITYWIPDSQAQILVPVTIVVTPDTTKNWLTVFTESMELLKEEEWGLTDYYPLNAKFELDNKTNTVIVDVPVDHQYGEGSTSETGFINLLEKNIASNSQVNKILLTTNGNPGIEFGNFGLIEEIVVKPKGKHAYFFHTPEGMTTTYLVPSTSTYQDIDTAFDAMKTDQPKVGLTASLVPSFPIKEVKVQNNKLIINFDQDTPMENNQDAVSSFEAILLTAKEFGFETITILNAPIKLLGPFDLSKEIQVPIAANYRPNQ
jgi:hypothetical protein